MSKELVKVLKEWMLRCPHIDKDLVFPNQIGNYLDPAKFIKRKFIPILRKAGVDRIRWHDLRHTYASLLIAQGVPVNYIQKQMGHGSSQITMDTYEHIMPEVTKQGVEALDSLFETKQIKGNLKTVNG